MAEWDFSRIPREAVFAHFLTRKKWPKSWRFSHFYRRYASVSSSVAFCRISLVIRAMGTGRPAGWRRAAARRRTSSGHSCPGFFRMGDHLVGPVFLPTVMENKVVFQRINTSAPLSGGQTASPPAALVSGSTALILRFAPTPYSHRSAPRNPRRRKCQGHWCACDRPR